MGKEISTFENIETEKKKKKFYHHKIPIFWGDVDIKKVLVSNNISVGEKKLFFLKLLYWLLVR